MRPTTSIRIASHLPLKNCRADGTAQSRTFREKSRADHLRSSVKNCDAVVYSNFATPIKTRNKRAVAGSVGRMAAAATQFDQEGERSASNQSLHSFN